MRPHLIAKLFASRGWSLQAWASAHAIALFWGAAEARVSPFLLQGSLQRARLLSGLPKAVARCGAGLAHYGLLATHVCVPALRIRRRSARLVGSTRMVQRPRQVWLSGEARTLPRCGSHAAVQCGARLSRRPAHKGAPARYAASHCDGGGELLAEAEDVLRCLAGRPIARMRWGPAPVCAGWRTACGAASVIGNAAPVARWARKARRRRTCEGEMRVLVNLQGIADFDCAKCSRVGRACMRAQVASQWSRCHLPRVLARSGWRAFSSAHVACGRLAARFSIQPRQGLRSPSFALPMIIHDAVANRLAIGDVEPLQGERLNKAATRACLWFTGATALIAVSQQGRKSQRRTMLTCTCV